MLVHVTPDNNIRGTENLVRRVSGTIETALSRFDPQITRVEVHLADENSHKGGNGDKSCALEARLAGLSPIAASATGDNLDQAIDGALDKLVAAIDHRLGRLQERKGRPSYGEEIAD